MLGDAGNREFLTEYADGAVVRTVDYAYDDLYRLTGETAYAPDSSVERSVSYAYDDFGNRVSKTDASGTVTYVYDRNDRLEDETGPDYTFTYDYDDNGNTLSRSDGTDTVSYTWDAENRMVSADDGSTVTTYGYDADGIRISSETDGEVTKYLVDKNRDYAQVLEETDGSGGLIVSYVYGDDLIRQKRGDAFSYYQYDGQLSTRQLTDADGNVTDTYTYDAFGDVLSQSGSTENSYLYTGEQYDPNAGFYYLRARYYDPAAGRFLSSDPYAGRTNEPVTLHKYLYANANPVMYNDPSGKTPLSYFVFKNHLGVKLLKRFSSEVWRTFVTIGRIVDRAICCDIKKSGYPNAVCQQPVEGGGKKGGYGYIDVYIPKNKIYEIKPLGGSANGYSQLTRYICANPKYIPGLDAIKGVLTDPLWIPGIQVEYERTGPGLIEYHLGLSPTGRGVVTAGITAMIMNSAKINAVLLESMFALRNSLAPMGFAF